MNPDQKQKLNLELLNINIGSTRSNLFSLRSDLINMVSNDVVTQGVADDINSKIDDVISHFPTTLTLSDLKSSHTFSILSTIAFENSISNHKTEDDMLSLIHNYVDAMPISETAKSNMMNDPDFVSDNLSNLNEFRDASDKANSIINESSKLNRPWKGISI